MALSREERRQQARAAGLRAGSFGEALPERVARGIVLARLANLLDGHAAVSGGLVTAVATLLDSGPLAPIPLRGNGGSGEIVALANLFGPLIQVATAASLRLQTGTRTPRLTTTAIASNPVAKALLEQRPFGHALGQLADQLRAAIRRAG